MKKHKYKNSFHCGDCFDKGMKKLVKAEQEKQRQPQKIIVSPAMYEWLKAHPEYFAKPKRLCGWADGWIKDEKAS